jgi:hypothetical protein
MDLKKWDCGVPGKEKTLWEGGLFKLEVSFPDGRFCSRATSTLDLSRNVDGQIQSSPHRDVQS